MLRTFLATAIFVTSSTVLAKPAVDCSQALTKGVVTLVDVRSRLDLTAAILMAFDRCLKNHKAIADELDAQKRASIADNGATCGTPAKLQTLELENWMSEHLNGAGEIQASLTLLVRQPYTCAEIGKDEFHGVNGAAAFVFLAEETFNRGKSNETVTVTLQGIADFSSKNLSK